MVENFSVNKKFILIFTVVFIAELLIMAALININGIEIFFRGDGRDYQHLANNLIYHKTLAIAPNSPYLPTSFRTPIYPLWLAFIYWVFKSYTVAIFIGAFIFALSAPIAYLIGREIFTEKIAVIAALFLGLEPWAVYQSGFLAAEQIFMPIFLLSVYLFCLYLKSGSLRNLYLATAIMGIAVLTRPVALLFIAIYIFLAFILELKHSLKKSFNTLVVISVIFGSVLIPWLVRNKIVLNSWQFSSASGIRVFGDYVMLKQYLNEFKPNEVVDIYEESRRLLNVKNDWEAMSIDNSNKMSEFALREIRSNFGSFLKMYSQNVFLFFFKNSYSNIFFDFNIAGSNIQSKIAKSLKRISNFDINYLVKETSLGAKTLLLLSLFWPLATFLAVFGAFKTISENYKNYLLWFLILWILYFSVLTANARDLSRYKLAVHLPIFLFAIYGSYKIKDYFLGHDSNH